MPSRLKIQCGKCSKVYQRESDFFEGTFNWHLDDKKNLWFDCFCKSSLMVKDGQYNTLPTEKFLNSNRETIFILLRDKRPFSGIEENILSLRKVLDNDNSSSRDIEREILKTPQWAATVLSIGRNIAFTSGDRIRELHHAISYLGRTMIEDLLVIHMAQGMKLQTTGFDVEVFWRTSLSTGAIAKILIQKKNLAHLNSNEVYLGAAMCNLGKLILAFYYPEIVDEIHRESQMPINQKNWQELEKKYNLYSHTIIGEIGAAFWHFPEFIIDGIRSHHSLQNPKADADTQRLSAAELLALAKKQRQATANDVIGLANQYVHWINGDPHAMDEELFLGFAKRLNMGKEKAEKLGEELSAMNILEHI